MYERILVPLDGSEVGESALPYIEGLIARFPPGSATEVTILQVVTQLSHWVVAGETGARVPYTERETELLREEAANYLEKVRGLLKSRGITVNIAVKFGNAADEILKTADEMDAGLIAMSTHGRSGLSRWAFGSVTAKVMRAAAIPVLMARAKEANSSA